MALCLTAHGALRAPPNEADLGPARFRASVHRRERCGPESDGGQLARRLVVRCARWPTGPGALRPRALAAAAAYGCKGSCRRRAAAEAALPAAQDRDREPAKPTKKHCNGFTRHGRQISPSLSHASGGARLVSSEAQGVARTRPRRGFFGDVWGSGRAAPSLASSLCEGPRTSRTKTTHVAVAASHRHRPGGERNRARFGIIRHNTRRRRAASMAGPSHPNTASAKPRHACGRHDGRPCAPPPRVPAAPASKAWTFRNSSSSLKPTITLGVPTRYDCTQNLNILKRSKVPTSRFDAVQLVRLQFHGVHRRRRSRSRPPRRVGGRPACN